MRLIVYFSLWQVFVWELAGSQSVPGEPLHQTFQHSPRRFTEYKHLDFMGNFPVKERLCVCSAVPSGLLREVCHRKNGFKQRSDRFCFSQQCKYFGSGEIGFHFSLFFFFTLFSFFCNRPSLQIVVLEKILHVQSEPGKFSPSCGPVCFYGALRG